MAGRFLLRTGNCSSPPPSPLSNQCLLRVGKHKKIYSLSNRPKPLIQVPTAVNTWVDKSRLEEPPSSFRPESPQPSSSRVRCGDYCFNPELSGQLIRCACLLSLPTLALPADVRTPSSSPSACLWLAGGQTHIIPTGQSRVFVAETNGHLVQPLTPLQPSSPLHFLSPPFHPIQTPTNPSLPSSHKTLHHSTLSCTLLQLYNHMLCSPLLHTTIPHTDCNIPPHHHTHITHTTTTPRITAQLSPPPFTHPFSTLLQALHLSLASF